MLARTVVSIALAMLVSTGAWAQQQQQNEGATFNYPVLIPEIALEAAQAALGECRDRHAQVAVAIVDRGGNVQVLLRDRFAGPHTPDTAIGKAWTAVSFRVPTTELMGVSEPGSESAGIRDLPGVVILGGGMPIEQGANIIGAIGVSGGPSGDIDDACAKAGIEAIREKLAL